jgi:interferon gamma-inducible protein 30
MKTFISLIFLSFIINSLSTDIPIIDVYIESLCPDCMDFINDSFRIFQENTSINKLAVINFYPYGNAQEKWAKDRWEFTCQHGPNECAGNTIETCALQKMDKLTSYEFIVCFESTVRKTKDFVNALNNCVSDEELRKRILECGTSAEGNNLQHLIAKITPAEHKYVPWVTVNGVHQEDVENKILHSLSEYVCDLQTEKLEGCKKRVSRLFETNFLEKKNKRCLN